MNGAKEYETKVVQVVINIKEAKAAEEQQKPELARQKTEQAREAASEALNTEKTLAKTTESLAATATPKSTSEPPSTAMSAVKFEKSSMPAIIVEKFEPSMFTSCKPELIEASINQIRIARLLSNREPTTFWRKPRAEEPSS